MIKKNRWRSKKYLDWIKTQPCARCGRPAEPHHLKGVGNVCGVGLKADDILTIPLCHDCHMLVHKSSDLWQAQWEQIARTVLQAVREGVLK